MIQRTGKELLEAIESEDHVWVRLGAILPDYQDQWELKVLDVTAGAPPPDWHPMLWTYDRAILWARGFSGASVARWLRSKSLSVEDVSIELPELQQDQPSPVHRHSSGALGVHGRFEWPCEEWTIQLNATNSYSLSEQLIGEGSTPCFIRPDIAFAAMLHHELSAGAAFDARSLIFRKQIRAARIRGVHVHPTRVEVEIDGDDLPGTTVELASNQPGPVRTISEGGEQVVELPTPTGLPAVPWIVVKRDGEWLDRRFLDPVYSRGQADDVDYWIEPSLRLEALIAGGEGPTTEFKREVPQDALGMMKSVAAFSNGAGGTILVGVAKDGSVVGAPEGISNPDGLDALTSKIRSWVDPLPDFDLQIVQTSENPLPVVAIFVRKGSLPPYGAGTTDQTIRYYVRRGATTFPASQDQVRELARATPPIEASDFGNYLK